MAKANISNMRKTICKWYEKQAIADMKKPGVKQEIKDLRLHFKPGNEMGGWPLNFETINTIMKRAGMDPESIGFILDKINLRVKFDKRRARLVVVKK